MSEKKGDEKKYFKGSKAAAAKAPGDRVQELLEIAKVDRDTAAKTMIVEGYGPSPIGSAFKQKTGKGYNGKTLGDWKKELEAVADVKTGEKDAAKVGGSVKRGLDKAFMTTVLSNFKKNTDMRQCVVIDLGEWVEGMVMANIPGETAIERMNKTKAHLRLAVDAYDPEKMKQKLLFGAQAFAMAYELRRRLRNLLNWAEPTARLGLLVREGMRIDKVNQEVYDKILDKYFETLFNAPTGRAVISISELPGLVQAYAKAVGLSMEVANETMTEALAGAA